MSLVRKMPSSQQWIKERRKALGYKDEDCCFGLSHMIKAAVISGKLDDFFRRIEWLSKISPTELKSLPMTDPRRLEAMAFFDGIELYQSGNNQKRMFTPETIPKSQTDVPEKVEPIVRAVEGAASIHVADFSNVYTRENFAMMMKSFRNTIKKIKPPVTHPISFVMGTSIHANSIQYNPKTDSFIYLSTNHLIEDTKNKKEFSDEKELAKYCISDFSLDKDGIDDWNRAIFNVSIYIPEQKNQTQIVDELTKWQKTKEWQEIHKLTPEKTLALDYFGHSWLFVASLMGQTELGTSLIEKKSDPNWQNELKNTPLVYAIDYNQLEMVKILLMNRANPNLVNSALNSPLHSAISRGNVEICKVLLEGKANPYLLLENKFTVLSLAQKLKRIPGNKETYEQIIKLLEERYIADKKDLYRQINSLQEIKLPKAHALIAERLKNIVLEDDKTDIALQKFFPSMSSPDANKNIIYFSMLHEEFAEFSKLENFRQKSFEILSKSKDSKLNENIQMIVENAYDTFYKEVVKGGNYQKAWTDLIASVHSLSQSNKKSDTMKSLNKLIPFEETQTVPSPDEKQMIKMAEQKGWGCKLYSMAAVLNKLHEVGAINEEPLPARKRDKSRAKSSLRQEAKKIAKEKFTEAIPSTKLLHELAELNHDVAASFVEAKNLDHYCQQLKDAVDYKLYPIVFFDVDSKTGQPILKHGSHEHAAIVTDYFVKDNKLKLKVTQWQKEYEFDAEDLYRSTSQLRAFKKGERDTFQKVRTKEGEGAWFPKERLHEFIKNPQIIKDYKNEITENNSYASHILLIDSLPRRQELIQELKKTAMKLNKKIFKGLVETAQAESLYSLASMLSEAKKGDLLHHQIEEWKKQESGYQIGSKKLTNDDLASQLNPSPFEKVCRVKPVAKINLSKIEQTTLRNPIKSSGVI